MEGNDIVMNYFLQFNDNNNTMAALTNNVNKVYTVQQKGNKQQLTWTDTWKKGTRLHF